MVLLEHPSFKSTLAHRGSCCIVKECSSWVCTLANIHHGKRKRSKVSLVVEPQIGIYCRFPGKIFQEFNFSIKTSGETVATVDRCVSRSLDGRYLVDPLCSLDRSHS